MTESLIGFVGKKVVYFPDKKDGKIADYTLSITCECPVAFNYFKHGPVYKYNDHHECFVPYGIEGFRERLAQLPFKFKHFGK